MNILIFSGTADGRRLSYELSAAGHAVTVSVASAAGKVFEEEGHAEIKTIYGRKKAAEMAGLMQVCDFVIDATHPYAVEVSREIRTAARAAGKRVLCLKRPASEVPPGAILVKTAGEAAAFLSETEGNILLTTGSKELAAFYGIDRDRLFVRILPTQAAVAAAEETGIDSRHILAMTGPFSAEMNELIIREKDIRYLVTKDGGREGGFYEKAEAAERTGIRLVLIERPEAADGLSCEAILGEVEAWEKSD